LLYEAMLMQVGRGFDSPPLHLNVFCTLRCSGGPGFRQREDTKWTAR